MVARVRGSYQKEADMAKRVDLVVRIAGSYETAVGIIAAETRERGGSLTEALIRLAQPKHFGEARQIAGILAGICAKREQSVSVIPPASSISIDRSKPFDPATFLGEGWSIWRGSTDGDGLSSHEDQDERSLALAELDLAKVSFTTMLRDGETATKGEEKLRRMKASGHIRLDAKVFETFWRSTRLIPVEWRKKGTVFFDGTILRSPNGKRHVLYLVWRGAQWHGCVCGLEDGWRAYFPSLVLASSSSDVVSLA